jgi:KDO2-lipid IV(A) lauroyltransferase
MDRARMSSDPGEAPTLQRTHGTAAPHEALFWRRAARWGATRGPEVWLKYGPPIIGWAAAACVPSARRAVRSNLRRVRGPKSAIRDARDVLDTFGTYASCLAEALGSSGDREPRLPTALVFGERWTRTAAADAKRDGTGIILVTAHTAGWDIVGPLLGRTYGLDLMIVTHAEPNAAAARLQDEARERAGVSVAHVGDPLASLPILRHLRGGGVVALQLDRIVPGMRTRHARVLDADDELPEGPFRLAMLSGAPIVPVFCARRRHREYLVQTCEPRRLGRRATEAEIDEAAAHIAACMTRFLRAHPTQWFQFGG